ncbi:capsule assembly Wzi family protein, partial [Aliidiomarina sp.]|uniref:capsule assembly Wzi family protein n=1 Tax=Aliidiomarina sp. TaxID=1872439 RepID=UPI003A4D759A
MAAYVLNTKGLVFVSGLALLGIGAVGTAQATPWADANDAQVRHYLQVLADAGVVQFSANTYPMMWGALLENMQGVDAGLLNREQQQAYFYVLSVLEFHAAGGYTGASLHGQSRTGAQRGFASAGSGVGGGEKGLLTISRDFKTDHSAFRLQTSYRTGREALPWRENDPQSISFAGSYAATMLTNEVLGSWVVGVDQLQTWWSPSYEHDGMHTRSERPLQALRVTRAGAAPFTTPVLSWLGPWSATAYVGRSERGLGLYAGADRLPSGERVRAREQAFGVRVTANPHTRLQLGSRFTGAHLGYTQKNAAVDARYALLKGTESDTRVQLAVYGELIYHDSALSTTYHTVGADVHLPLTGDAPSSLRLYAEQLAHYSRDTLAVGFDHFTTAGYGWGVRVRDIDYFANHWRAAYFLEPDVLEQGAALNEFARYNLQPVQRYQLDVQVYRPLGDGRVVLGAQWWRDSGAAG